MGSRGREKTIVIRITGLMGPKTERTVTNVEESLDGYEKFCDVKWISDPIEISRFAPTQMPALYVNGELRAAGRVPSVHEVRTWIEEVLQESHETSKV